ncbi:MAG: CarD family transcriptional regulator [Campylobacter sputorum]|uniref:DEAD/DEAH box helicase n=1 Tax=Campylobacter sputorum TaxID=206 RepID=UPI000B78C37E|nr:DEAD/DEAH box helicase [Campylobacter sputorum]ASM38331.1 transcription-repair coupling factor [Campylobacter sputorum bv. paraureolyticus LMG 11764]MDY6119755.1 CarD family transcriptional regulator [Campylobacter sputorum]
MQSEIYEFCLEKNDFEIIVCDDDKEASVISDVVSYCGIEAYRLPDFRASFGDDLRPFNAELFEISSVLNSFYKSSSKKLLISPIRTLLNKLPSKSHFYTINLSFADKIDLNSFKEEILRFGYNIVDIVESEAEVSFRGEIIDIFCIGKEKPFRVLLNDDEIESIRYYDPSTQKSDKIELESIEISPFLAYLSKNEYENVTNKISQMQSDAFVNDLNSLGFWAIDGFENYFDKFKVILANDINLQDIITDTDLSFLKKLPVIKEAKNFKDLNTTLSKEFLEFHKDKKITILSKNDGIFKSYELDCFSNINLKISPYVVNLISKDEIILSLNKFEKKKRVRKSSLVLDELNSGDLVVHEDYGIGKFDSLELVEILGAKREFVAIIYQNNDKLLLPVEHLNKIDRYIAGSGNIAVLDKLGKGSFTKIKEKVRQKLFAIASNIIALAAKRELIKGVKIECDSLEYLKFMQSAGFEYTKDQIKAIDDISKDLASGKVMDRLISGDVGFGKTEVAMNAIFKTIKSGYSVLFFVPTTLLSSQHYTTLKERFKSFDIDVFKFDRFTSAKEKAEIKKQLQSDKPCVCIGTHALLSIKDLSLGLIIIDEEHKFGVKQKEQLKEISSSCHLLSMSATPIPRSLNMALSSIKSYSTLTTPPQNRLDIRTLVKEWDEKIIKEAIARELRRGGQTFYIHNHIATMESAKKELLGIIPNLKILILHSKIDPKTTEIEMIKFANKEYDVLLCTSIVESGIHLPNVNTIIINNANNFGMADLHQLRGRVGRSDKQGFCYFLVENKLSLSSQSVKRLVSLESNSFLGAGSVLAYHDLEIRGGGNLVGVEQSGHIEAIGYSLYLRMLETQINTLLNQNLAKENKEIELKLSINAFLNSDFISEDRLRLELYRRLSKCSDVKEVYEIQSEIEDRFGRLDIYTLQFIELMAIKVMAIKQDFVYIGNYEQNITLKKQNGESIKLKSKSKDDDDIINEVLVYLRKESSK